MFSEKKQYFPKTMDGSFDLVFTSPFKTQPFEMVQFPEMEMRSEPAMVAFREIRFPVPVSIHSSMFTHRCLVLCAGVDKKEDFFVISHNQKKTFRMYFVCLATSRNDSVLDMSLAELKW